MMYAMWRHVEDMAHGTCPRQRVLRGASRAAARRQPHPPPPARAARPPVAKIAPLKSYYCVWAVLIVNPFLHGM